jgi:hypothetical protein
MMIIITTEKDWSGLYELKVQVTFPGGNVYIEEYGEVSLYYFNKIEYMNRYGRLKLKAYNLLKKAGKLISSKEIINGGKNG